MKRVKELEKLILECKKNYYTNGLESNLSDEEYDSLENELKSLDPKNKVLSVVGSNYFTKEKVSHSKKMLSLDKTYDLNDLGKWAEDHSLLVTQKIDGNSCSLIYKDKKISDAKTRGDGSFGERILIAVNFIEDIPKNIKLQDCEIRGEIFCKKENFETLVKEMVSRGLDAPKSERNIVSGILGRKDHYDLAKYLSFFAFEIVESTEDEDKTFERLRLNNFIIPPIKKIEKYTEKEFQSEVDNMIDFMSNGNYLIDGLVVTYNSKDTQIEMGYTGHHPKYKKAFKVAGEIKETEITDIEWQISKHGVYTPVAILAPVELTGATIGKVTLHNAKTVIDHNLKSGDTIKLTRSGEVIPKFLSVSKSSNNDFCLPENCSFCNSVLEYDSVRLSCVNDDCSGKKSQLLISFVQKIGVDDLSSKRIEKMIESGLVSSISDFYKLNLEDLLTLESTKEKMANKILKNIKKTKKTNIIQLCDSLSFVGGAKNKIKLLLDEGHDSLEKFHSLKVEDVVKIKGFQEKSANDFINALEDNKSLIQELVHLGFEIEFPKSNGELKNLVFCITGNLSIKRDVIENILKDKGAKVTGSVSKNTSFLICNEDSNSGKSKKAKDLKITILTEEDLKLKFSLEY